MSEISNWWFGDRDFFRFQNDAFAVLLVVLLVVGIGWSWYKKKVGKGFNSKVNSEHKKLLFPSLIAGRFMLKFAIWMLGVLMLIVGIVGPQFGSKKEEVQQKGVDVVFALDVSKSMLAEDIKPNRLQRAKHAIGKVIDRLGSDRVAIVVFAGDAYVQLPLTSDHGAAKMYLNEIDVNMIPIGGTSLSRAMERSKNAFAKDNKGGAIIMITDGEDQDEEAVSMAKQCKEEGVKVYTLGVGTKEGSTVPEVVNGVKVGIKRDRSGGTVVSKINEALLVEVASEGGGDYIRASNKDLGLDHLYNQIRSLDETEYGAKKFTSYDHKFQYFLLLGLVLLVIEFLLFDNKWLKNEA